MRLHRESVNIKLVSLLEELVVLPFLNKYRLVGGTNLALRYGHRISTDIDLFIYEKPDADKLLILSQELINYFSHRIEITSTSGIGVFCFIDDIKIDLVSYFVPWLKSVENIENIPFATEDDIMAMKINAIINRGTQKDFFDIYLLFKKNYTIDNAIILFKNKYSIQSSQQTLLSLSYFEDAELFQNVESLNNTTWIEVKQYIIKKVHNYQK